MPLLPPPEKQGEIKFLIAKSMPYKLRLAVIAASLLSGLAVQLLFSFWPGFAILVLASLMGMAGGYDAKPRPVGGIKWEKVTPDEYRKVRERAEALKQWDSNAFDFSNPLGAGVLLLTAMVCLGVYFVLLANLNLPEGFWVFLALDAGVMLLPLWFTGVRDYLVKDKLIIKIGHLEGMMRRLEEPSDVQVSPMLGLQDTREGKKVPEDARLMVKLVGAPEEFMGLQAQLSINSVKGTDHPYLYCVLIAKKESGFLDGYKELVPQREESLGQGILQFLGLGAAYVPIYEPAPSDEVDVLVIRQYADRNGGYSTSLAQAWTVVSAALDMARKLSDAFRARQAGKAA